MAIADLAPGHHAARVRNHWWWRPGWRIGRRFLAFHLTFEGHPEARGLINLYRSALRGNHATTLVPDQWLHLTMQGLGFADEVSATTLNRAITATRERLQEHPPFMLWLGDIVVADEAIALLADPPEPVQQLRTVIRSAIGEAMDKNEVPEDPHRFRPHVTVAYINAESDSHPYLEAVGKVTAEPVNVRITAVSLIRMHRDNQMYEWETIATLPLLGVPGPGY